MVPADLPMPCWSHPIGLSLVDPPNRGTWCCRRGSHGHGHQSAAATDCHDGPVATTSRPRTRQRSWPRLHPQRRWWQPRPSRPLPPPPRQTSVSWLMAAPAANEEVVEEVRKEVVEKVLEQVWEEFVEEIVEVLPWRS